ncbi:mas-related G-protein coupled receptor member H-like [Hemicordylus capensis]|uniref:mas-related G-protein coupled receptor member H-like n=1 Tax=Hemicordylus capensis TaxID=884348 RepID=UPI0023048E18|nr:mas-related G-protein coupled receptor member H-like [Hemicordylus capensis]XP_053105120.1 mas-related G-protein coupled receptor member H-like [Hemicordylus capensis]XP_053105121.1 mas-related G-protein coupled receptor member H-like [Hemicordylus capensis]
MSNSSKSTLLTMNVGPECYDTHNGSGNIYDLSFPRHYYLEKNITWILMLVICLFGVLGNGTMIWLLGFHIKRTPFTTYILNLAAADFGVLISGAVFFLFLIFQKPLFPFPLAYFLLRLFMYITGHVLLTAISIDRFVSVFFPVWHRCHRPGYLSHTVCALIWVISFLLSGLCVIHLIKTMRTFSIVLKPVSVTTLVCFPLMTISTLILFIQVCYKTEKAKRGKLSTAILITLFFCILFSFPFNVMYLITFFKDLPDHVMAYGFLGACLDSSSKPIVYFLVGRHQLGKFRESLKFSLQSVFKEEQVCRDEVESSVESQL